MHLHILGISGTFMSALAILAQESGFTVSGSDKECYPPVSDLLAEKGIRWSEGYDDASDALKADQVIIGNTIKRGNPVLEAVLNHKKNFTSGPQWLAETLLTRYRVIAVAGTHGKTTTTSMLASILVDAGLEPGFLIGGVATNFNTSARLGKGKWFIIEADEYDTAFFDKRPKLMHYRPEIAILNNLEFDHADIYPDLAAIQQQFHYYLKTIPSKGVVLKPKHDEHLNEVIRQGIFSKLEEFTLTGDATWKATILDEQGEAFRVWHHGEAVADIHWPLIGRFNIENGLAALAASFHAGVSPEKAARSLSEFTPVKRRLEVKSNHHGVTVYDDFAHHPTAISKTIQALKDSTRHNRILVVLEFASYTMKTGVHANAMAKALNQADYAFILNPEQFNLSQTLHDWTCPHQLLPNTDAIVKAVTNEVRQGDAVLIMSNRGFNHIHDQVSTQIDLKFKALGRLQTH